MVCAKSSVWQTSAMTTFASSELVNGSREQPIFTSVPYPVLEQLLGQILELFLPSIISQNVAILGPSRWTRWIRATGVLQRSVVSDSLKPSSLV